MTAFKALCILCLKCCLTYCKSGDLGNQGNSINKAKNVMPLCITSSGTPSTHGRRALNLKNTCVAASAFPPEYIWLSLY